MIHSLWSLKTALPVLLLAALDVTAAPGPLEVLADNEAQYTLTGEGRQTSVAVDIAEQTAAKTALQKAAAELAQRLAPEISK